MEEGGGRRNYGRDSDSVEDRYSKTEVTNIDPLPQSASVSLLDSHKIQSDIQNLRKLIDVKLEEAKEPKIIGFAKKKGGGVR